MVGIAPGMIIMATPHNGIKNSRHLPVLAKGVENYCFSWRE